LTHTCTVCASPDVIAIQPGVEGERFADLFTVVRPVADVAWCERCWRARFGADLLSMPDRVVTCES
jgi:hypothetical protein